MGELQGIQTIIIGAGQAGLSTGYHLAQQGLPFLILDANPRVGDAWRKRWDSLRLFTPARYDGLDGMPYPGDQQQFITKDEMGAYLESYVERFKLPVVGGARVESLRREGDRYRIRAGDREYEADQVVVAMATYQDPRVPDFARDLNGDIVQMHSSAYRNATQLRDGPVLIVGAGNSGAEIALETIKTRPTLLSGRNTGHIPWRLDGVAANIGLVHFIFRVLFHRILTRDTFIGRKAQPRITSKGTPLIRIRPNELERAGVKRVARVAGIENGKPKLEDGTVVEVANVIWSTGYHPGFSWIHLPGFDQHEPVQYRGVAQDVPGLYFVGLEFLYAMSSTMIHGVGRDAAHVANAIAERIKSRGFADKPRLVA
jgi:putative flavoprotein involved in K+ transport